MNREFKQGNKVRHFKGGMYTVLMTAKNSEIDEEYVVYQSETDGTIYVREINNFYSKVDKIKYTDITQLYRFELVGEGK